MSVQGMKMWSLTQEKKEELLRQRDNKQQELKNLQVIFKTHSRANMKLPIYMECKNILNFLSQELNTPLKTSSNLTMSSNLKMA